MNTCSDGSYHSPKLHNPYSSSQYSQQTTLSRLSVCQPQADYEPSYISDENHESITNSESGSPRKKASPTKRRRDRPNRPKREHEWGKGMTISQTTQRNTEAPPTYTGQKGPETNPADKVVGYWIPEIEWCEEPTREVRDKRMIVPDDHEFPYYGGFEIGPDDEHLLYFGPKFWALPAKK
jgi:hypothetical protein